MEYIAIVNELDEIKGYEEKIYVHEQGILHRAFSVILYNDNKKILIQQRSSKKYHSPSLWTNSCCSHERKSDKTILNAAKRRVFEELGIERIEIKEVDIFKYKCDFKNGLIENEIDHIFIGKYNGEVNFNREEIDAVKWISEEEILQWIEDRPEEFTYWFKVLMNRKIEF